MKLAKREKLFISAAACVLGVFLIISQVLIPYFDKKESLRKKTEELEKSIGKLNTIGAEGLSIDKTSGNLENALANRKESLYSFINKAAVSINLELPGMKPSEGKELDGYVEDFCVVDLKAVTLPQLTDFLYRIEKPEKYIFISSITIRDNKKEEGYLDADIRVKSYKKVQPRAATDR
ncbi:MAG: hypothetical protein PVG39_10150 [Desulfobacteraceae bacterium]|jgi:Tfp pilus assembly protein PilO